MITLDDPHFSLKIGEEIVNIGEVSTAVFRPTKASVILKMENGKVITINNINVVLYNVLAMLANSEGDDILLTVED